MASFERVNFSNSFSVNIPGRWRTVLSRIRSGTFRTLCEPKDSAARLRQNASVLLRRRLSTSRWHCAEAEHAKFFAPVKTPMLPAGTFQGKVAFISGGGTGLGKGMAAMLSQLGASVTIASRKIDVLQKTADEISSETGNKVLAVACDVREPRQVQEAVSACVGEFGLPSIVINNAAGNFVAPFERLSNNAWNSVINIVLNGTANLTLDIGKRLITANRGAAFLAISTPYSQTGSAYVVPSASAKAGVEAMTKSLASEWSHYGMRFNVIQAGPFETKGAFSRLDPTNQYRDIVTERVSVGRMGEIAELCNLACYLVSDYASFMNASIIQFDGGEYNNMAGSFNLLKQISKEQWDMMENKIRQTKGS